MKTMNKGISTAIDKNELKELLNETKETIATGVLKNNGSATIFTQVDLWRMQKKHKTIGSSTRW